MAQKGQRFSSKIMTRGGTNVPQAIRKWLNLEEGDLLLWTVSNQLYVTVQKGRITEVPAAA